MVITIIDARTPVTHCLVARPDKLDGRPVVRVEGEGEPPIRALVIEHGIDGLFTAWYSINDCRWDLLVQASKYAQEHESNWLA